MVRRGDHVGHRRRRASTSFRDAHGQHLQSGRAGARRSRSTSSTPARAGGARCRTSPPYALIVLLATGHLHHRPRQQDADGAGVSRRLLPAVHDHGVRRRSGAGRRDLPRARSAGGAVLRVLHPDRSADVTARSTRTRSSAASSSPSSASPCSSGSAPRTTCWPACSSGTSVGGVLTTERRLQRRSCRYPPARMTRTSRQGRIFV